MRQLKKAILSAAPLMILGPVAAQDRPAVRAVESRSAQSGPEPVTINGSWLVRKADNHPQRRVFRRFSITKNMDLPNVMMLHCPKDRGSYVHVSLELRRVGPVKEAFTSDFENFSARVLVNGHRSFSLPGEFIKSELFFDRTPETWEDFDALVNADEFQLRFGQREARVAFKVNPEFTKDLPKILQIMKAGSMTYYTTEGALRDRRKYHGEL